MELLRDGAAICSEVTVILGAITLFVKPLRERIFGTLLIKDGLKCLLRAEMLHAYYRHKNEGKIRQYELENFIRCYEAYKALGGNSFIDHIYAEVREWEVIT